MVGGLFYPWHCGLEGFRVCIFFFWGIFGFSVRVFGVFGFWVELRDVGGKIWWLGCRYVGNRKKLGIFMGKR